jgi:hypothetical protein
MSEKRSSDIVSKAISESSSIRDLAIDAAKREIMEAVTPGIKRMIDRQLASNTLSEDQDRMNRHRDGYGETAFEEGTDKMADENDLDLESIAGMFPQVNEVEEDDVTEAKGEDDEMPACDENDIPTLGEGDDLEMDEEISISESELDKVYKESLKVEMQLSKGFKETPPPDEEVDAGAGVHDVKSGEHPWEDQEPPAKQNWTVSEVRKLFKAGLAENAALKKLVAQLRKENKTVKEHLSKVNLFNQKVLHVNKFFVEHKLNDKQKKAVVEAFDAATSPIDCKKTYKMLESTFRASGVVSEGRSKAKANSQRARKAGADERVIRESVDKSASDDSVMYSRWRQLSGLTNK